MKNIIASIILVVLLGSCNNDAKIVSSPETQKQSSTKISNNEINENVFSNEALNLSFSYPKNWEVQTDTINKVVYIMSNSSSDDGFKEMINIMIGAANTTAEILGKTQPDRPKLTTLTRKKVISVKVGASRLRVHKTNMSSATSITSGYSLVIFCTLTCGKVLSRIGNPVR